MTSKILIACLVFLALTQLILAVGHGDHHKHVKIIVPIKHYNKNVHLKKIIEKHIKYSTIDDGHVVGGHSGEDGFANGKVSGSFHIGEPSYSHHKKD